MRGEFLWLSLLVGLTRALHSRQSYDGIHRLNRDFASGSRHAEHLEAPSELIPTTKQLFLAGSRLDLLQSRLSQSSLSPTVKEKYSTALNDLENSFALLLKGDEASIDRNVFRSNLSLLREITGKLDVVKSLHERRHAPVGHAMGSGADFEYVPQATVPALTKAIELIKHISLNRKGLSSLCPLRLSPIPLCRSFVVKRRKESRSLRARFGDALKIQRR